MQVLRAHWLIVVLLTILGGALAFGWTLTQDKVYASTGSAIITTGASTSLGDATVGDSYAKSRVKSYLDVAKSGRVAEYAAEQLGAGVNTGGLAGRVTVSNPSETALLRVTATGPTPRMHARSLKRGSTA
ncbi:hypothetical protein GCM10025873_25130 [Demequina sediminis]|nr:hypothetical protein GCM10025873_25130 [Demequina sediminis]